MKNFLILLMTLFFLGCTNDLYKIPDYSNIALDAAKADPVSALLGNDIVLTVDAVVLNQVASVSGKIYDESGKKILTLDSVSDIKRTITLTRRVNLPNPGRYTVVWTLKTADGKSVKTLKTQFSVIEEGAPIPVVDFVENIYDLKIGGTVQIQPASSVPGAAVNDAVITDVIWETQYLSGNNEWVTAVETDADHYVVFPASAYKPDLSSYFEITLPRTLGTYRFALTLTNSYGKKAVGYSPEVALGYQPLPPSENVIFFSFAGMIGPFDPVRQISSEQMTSYGKTVFESVSLLDGIRKAGDDSFLGLLMPFSFIIASTDSDEQTLFSVSGNDGSYFSVYQKGKNIGMRMTTENGSRDLFNQNKAVDLAVGDEIPLVLVFDRTTSAYILYGSFGSIQYSAAAGDPLFFGENSSSVSLGAVNLNNSALNPAEATLSISGLTMYNVTFSEEITAWAVSYTERSSVDQSPIFPNIDYLADFKMVQAGDETRSQYFRIPVLLTLRNPDGTLDNTVLAIQDVRYSGNSDSPANIDTGIRISTDGGLTFGRHMLIPSLTFDDRPRTSGTAGRSASYIDPCVFQNWATGRIFVVPDAFPWGAGLMGGNVGVGTPFRTVNGKTVMSLTPTAEVLNGTAPKTSDTIWETACKDSDVTSVGTYYVENVDIFPEYVTDGNGSIQFDENGYALLQSPVKRKIYDNRNVYTNYFLNERFEVCYDDGSDRGQILRVRQIGGAETVPMNIMYQYSIFQMYRTSYNYVVYSDDKGKTWSDPINITGQVRKPENHVTYLIAGPGTGLYIDDGPYKGRVMMSLYSNKSEDGILNNEIACVIWSNDNGHTWTRGKFPTTYGNTGKLSESVPVKMPNGNIRLFCRTSVSYVGTVLSTDGGETWGEPKRVDGIYNSTSSGCQLTAFNYPVKIDGYPAVILASPQSQSARSDGTMWVGLIKDQNGDDIEWRYKRLIHQGGYSYSCAAPLPIYSAAGLPAIGLYAEITGNVMSYVAFPFEYLQE